MNDTAKTLALNFIKHGITPLFLEQSGRVEIRKKVEQEGFTQDELQDVLDRWDIKTARLLLEKQRRNNYDRAAWAKKKEEKQ